MTFRNLFVFVVLNHDRRLIRHIALTSQPGAGWTSMQLIEALRHGPRSRYLVRHRDKLFAGRFSIALKMLGVENRRTAPRQPWQNGKCERVMSTLRRECTDHFIPFTAGQLQAHLRAYVVHYNQQPCNLALERNGPVQ